MQPNDYNIHQIKNNKKTSYRLNLPEEGRFY